jgi:hypothetical protein
LTSGAWLIPRPRRKRLPQASTSVAAPFAAATASRPQMLAMPVATWIRSVQDSTVEAWVNASLVVGPSPNQYVEYPNCSTACTRRRSSSAGALEADISQTPTLPRRCLTASRSAGGGVRSAIFVISLPLR